MTIFEYLTENHEAIKALTKAGIIAPFIPAHYSIYSKYKHLKDRDIKIGKIYEILCGEFHYSQNMVYRIIKEMQKEI